jgi:hypothetical protein
VHPSDNEAWKAPDNFDADFTSDARNIRIKLATNDFSTFYTNATHTLVGPSLIFRTSYHVLFA